MSDPTDTAADTVKDDTAVGVSPSSSDSGDVPGYEFLSYVLGNLVEDKDQLVIESKIDDLGVLLTVKVSDNDMGKLIGKNGQTIKSLRTLLRTLGGKVNQRINVKVIEPGS